MVVPRRLWSPSYRPGTIEWASLATPDPVTSTAFYEQVLGRFVGGVVPVDAAGQSWRPHVAVRSVARTARRVRRHGGRVVEGPTPVGTVGRTVVLADPWGAVFAASETPRVWGEGPRWAYLVPGATEELWEFYGAVLRWDLPGYGRHGGRRRSRPSAGIRDELAGPPRWIVLFGTEDPGVTVDRARAAGAQVTLQHPAYALLVDPLGTEFGVCQPDEDWW